MIKIAIVSFIASRIGSKATDDLEIVSVFPKDETIEMRIIRKVWEIDDENQRKKVYPFEKKVIYTYDFEIPTKFQKRDISYSVSLVSDKRDERIYIALEKIINSLKEESLLTEEILLSYEREIYEAINREDDLVIEGRVIGISEVFQEEREKLKDLGGAFL